MQPVQCRICHATALVRSQAELNAFNAAHAHRDQYMGLGDVIASGIKKVFGIKPCGGCEQRRQSLNNFAPRVWRR